MISGLLGLMTIFPLVLQQIWVFFKPGLMKSELQDAKINLDFITYYYGAYNLHHSIPYATLHFHIW